MGENAAPGEKASSASMSVLVAGSVMVVFEPREPVVETPKTWMARVLVLASVRASVAPVPAGEAAVTGA